MAIVEQLHSTAEVEADLAELRRLVEAGCVEEARRLAPELAAKWPDSRAVQNAARVLEPPHIIPSPPGLRGRNFDREHAWLREHAHEHPGCWLGVFEDRLIAADPDLKVVRKALRRAAGDEPGLLHFQPASAA